MKNLSALILSTLLILPTLAHADDDDHDRARRAVESGEIVPLRSILDDAESSYGGQLIEAELERHDGRLIYELKLLTVDGRLLKVYYDAHSGLPLHETKRDDRK